MPDETTAPVTPQRPPMLTIIAAVILVLCWFTPRLIVMLPLMAAVGLCIVAIFRKERPVYLPYVGLGVAAVILVITQMPLSSWSTTAKPALKNAEIFKDATWTYDASKDAMRGTVNKYASLNSPTDFELDAPYNGDNSGSIIVTKFGSIIFSVTQGQIICHSDDKLAVSFDGGPVINFPCSTPDNGDTNTVYLQSAYEGGRSIDLPEKIATSKVMIIEVPFYQSGVRQFTFKVAGLDLKRL